MAKYDLGPIERAFAYILSDSFAANLRLPSSAENEARIEQIVRSVRNHENVVRKSIDGGFVEYDFGILSRRELRDVKRCARATDASFSWTDLINVGPR